MQTQKVSYPSKKIKIGSKNWTILVVPYDHPKLGKGNWGRCQCEEQAIYILNSLGQKDFKETLTHELLHAMFDSIGFHDKLVKRIKTKANERMVDGLAHQICRMLRPDIFKIPHLMRIKQRTRS